MFSNPERNIEQFDLQSGSRVADLGAGSGAYALAAARAVGEAGRVYAVDVQKGLLEKLANEARRAGIRNIEVVWGDIEEAGGTHLADESADAAIVSNTLFQAEHREGLADEARRILRPGGKILLVDWSESFGGVGPDAAHIVSKGEARRVFERAGFIFARDIEASEHHYGMIFKKG